MLLGDQALESFCQLGVPIVPGVRASFGQVQITLVLQCLGRGAVRDPVLLELIEVLSSLQDDDYRG
jgi:hypothetical protein